PATDFSGSEGFEVYSDRVQPHSPGLSGRMWYGSGSLRSARWAGENGMNLLLSSVVKVEEPAGGSGESGGTAEGTSSGTEGSFDFAAIQLSHIRAFRAHHPDGERARVSQGLVVIPT